MAKRGVNKNTMRNMLKCRAYGHNWLDRGWLPISAIAKGRSVSGWDQQFTCDRCTAIREDFRARATFKLIRRSYTLPDGYPGDIKQFEALKSLIQMDAAA